MAQKRASEALAQITSGQSLLRRKEPKVPYNGAEGVPIREEVLSRHGEVIVTRNAYGAECLNSPDVVFADIDFETRPGSWSVFLHGTLLLLLAAGLSAWFRSGWGVVVAALLVLGLSFPLSLCTHKLYCQLRGGPLKWAMARVQHFSRRHPDWHLRLYRTPAGLRVLVMHQVLEPRGPEVAALFSCLRVDPVYARMCRNQNCFRARLTPKPWRIGMDRHMRPRPGVWPIRLEHHELRAAWVREYARLAASFAACEFLQSFGGSAVHPKAAKVAELHDQLSHALSGKPIA